MPEKMTEACQHKFVHMETARYSDSGGGYNIRYVRMDRFFCEKCLHEEIREKAEYSREAPEWWRQK